MTHRYFVWDMSPVVFSAGPVTIRWYGLFFVGAFVAGHILMTAVYKKEGRPVQDLSSLMNHLLLGTIIGARLGHCLFYDPAYYLGHPVQILKIWEGGLASHGGAAGILAALLIYSYKKKDQGFLWLMDRIALPAAFGGALIRTGNFFNSEIVGRPTAMPWAVVFQRVDPLPRHPSQLYESIACLLIFIILGMTYRKDTARNTEGLISGLFLTLVFSSRIALEFFKVPQAAYNTEMILNTGQWLSIPFVLVGMGLIAEVWTDHRFGIFIKDKDANKKWE
ncbi:prolipoprotein diacylglyceryl transferase [Desulfobacter vibrioformis]|uniref:prolipoprotein diacylglyceryl transferase n=1 Tax=Desulfobacter vibrioformis TaxID=34031 RepID=UPI000AD8F330|nr:prolipoprotein diacylglyceryl transferase [Desulfobacter vibrioformis]